MAPEPGLKVGDKYAEGPKLNEYIYSRGSGNQRGLQPAGRLRNPVGHPKIGFARKKCRRLSSWEALGDVSPVTPGTRPPDCGSLPIARRHDDGNLPKSLHFVSPLTEVSLPRSEQETADDRQISTTPHMRVNMAE